MIIQNTRGQFENNVTRSGGRGFVKIVTKCDIGGGGSKQSAISHLSSDDAMDLRFIFTL